jgi:2-hydroxychromene-2-carboxylate isomerase
VIRAEDLKAELYWSFRSPYSYLALPRVRRLAAEYRLQWSVRLVYPLAMRTPDYFRHMNPLARPYFFRDTQRVADYLGMSFRRPVPDPIVQDPITLEIAPSQPYIHRLTLLGAEATLRGKALPFIDEVARLLWDGTVTGWDEGEHLARAAARAGLDLERAAGHWGVPLFVFDGESFFGQDRIDVLLWRMKQKGLRPRG